jgi:hypothetical protein
MVRAANPYELPASLLHENVRCFGRPDLDVFERKPRLIVSDDRSPDQRNTGL